MQGVIVANKSFLNGTPELFLFSNRASADNIFNMAPKKEMQGFKSGDRAGQCRGPSRSIHW
jgi:hypothetical protein